MKRIISITILIVSFLLSKTAGAQGQCVSSCGTTFIMGLDSFVKGQGNTSCNPALKQHRIILPAACSMIGCNSTKDRRVFAYASTAPQSQTMFMMWATYTTAISHWGFYGLCQPGAGEYAHFVGDTTLGETGCVSNDVDGVRILKIVNGSLQNEYVNDITGISNPRIATPADAFWPFIKLSEYANIYSGTGVLVDVTITGNITYTGMIWHSDGSGLLQWKQACNEYFIPPPSATVCAGAPVAMKIGNPSHLKPYFWSFGDGSTGVGTFQNHIYNSAGIYTVSCSFLNASNPFTTAVTVQDCKNVTCSSCIGGFAPDPGDYVVSLWVKEDNTNSNPPPVAYYANTGIRISFTQINGYAPITTTYTAYGSTSAPIIDGWQRIEKNIHIPPEAAQIHVELLNNNGSGIDSYFDDIRIHPVDASMKSYVYDPVNLRLVTELDENNYATFYEYDEEGKLIRVKKETERGIMTIKETRSATKKR